MNSSGSHDKMLPARFPVICVGVSAITLETATATIHNWITNRNRQYVNVCTTHTILECYDAPPLRQIVNHSGMATPDGMPLVWLGRLNGLPVERVYGPDLMLAVCGYGQAHGYRHYFYGGATQVPDQLAEKLQIRFPDMRVAGCFSPPFRDLTNAEEQEVAAQINASAADVVWVGLGTPRQDYWIARMRPLLEAPVLIAVGAAFDFHSGRVRQAPRWMQRSGLEWLFRLSQDPQRLWKRYIVGNPRFVALILWQWIRHRSSGRIEP